jgi:hypothetical protein
LVLLQIGDLLGEPNPRDLFVLVRVLTRPRHLSLRRVEAENRVRLDVPFTAHVAAFAAHLAGPVYDAETILAADLDHAEIDRESMTLDTSGPYYRDDVFEFGVRRSRRK